MTTAIRKVSALADDLQALAAQILEEAPKPLLYHYGQLADYVIRDAKAIRAHVRRWQQQDDQTMRP